MFFVDNATIDVSQCEICMLTEYMHCDSTCHGTMNVKIAN